MIEYSAVCQTILEFRALDYGFIVVISFFEDFVIKQIITVYKADNFALVYPEGIGNKFKILRDFTEVSYFDNCQNWEKNYEEYKTSKSFMHYTFLVSSDVILYGIVYLRMVYLPFMYFMGEHSL